ncbi:response regulator [Haliangium ochraceum]|nr:response regulator [Haliangium ochraceum]
MPTVLIVDDDKYTQTVLHTALSTDTALTELDIHAITADDGAGGLAAFRKHRPAVVATDLRMPRMDGVALCRAIRAEPGGAEVHLVAMSGTSRDAAAADTVRQEYGAEVFAKPYQLRDMATYIAALLTGATPPGAAHATPHPEQAGELGQRPLPAVLFDFLEARATGKLTLRRGRVEKQVDLLVGHPLSVWSSAREEALGAFLQILGIIREGDLKRALQWAARRRGKVSEALIALGIVTPEDMVSHITMHTCHKLVQSLRWSDGTWAFQPHTQPDGGSRGNPIDMVPLVLQGLRHTVNFDGLPERVRGLEDKPLTLTPRGQRMLPSVRQHLSSKLADEWAEGNTTGALLAAGVERGELFATLDAMLLCDAVSVYDHPIQLESGPIVMRDTGDFSIEELSEHSQLQRAGRGTEEAARELYAMLFDDPGLMSPVHVGELPIEFPDDDDFDASAADSGVIEVAALQRSVGAATAESESNYARRLVLKEYLRIQGRDYYDIFELEHDAAHDAVLRAVEKRRTKFSLDWFARYDLGRDYAKLEEIHAAYDRAEGVLCDPAKRTAYHRSLSFGEQPSDGKRPLAAEIAYLAGIDLLQHGSYADAVAKLQAAIAASPDEADFHATLGWACYLDGQRSAQAADEARPHLNQGLAINPDHALSHQYKGLISAEHGTDEEEAIFHLERALLSDPSADEALYALEAIWKRRGELRPLEREYRRLIYRIARSDPQQECRLWLKLANLYRDELQEPENARIAYESAARLAPEDESVYAALGELQQHTPERFAERREFLRRQWRRSPLSAKPGIDMVHAALAANQPDPAFLAASALVARGCADDETEAFYMRYRPRFVIRAQRPLDAQIWQYLRHAHDSLELGALVALLTPAVIHSFPLSFDDLEVDPTMAVDEEDLPEAFRRVRAYVAHMLGVPIPRVFIRPDFGHQIHIGALHPPVLLAGDDALTSPERSELSFRLGRAMSYLLPGRAIAASRPARLLKAAVLAVFSHAAGNKAAVEDPAGLVAQMREGLGRVPPESLAQARDLVTRITSQSQSLNLSRWVRAQGRTANRVGLLLCGDLPAAVRFARDSGTTAGIDDMIDFAVSGVFASLRAQIGLSIDV